MRTVTMSKTNRLPTPRPYFGPPAPAPIATPAPAETATPAPAPIATPAPAETAPAPIAPPVLIGRVQSTNTPPDERPRFAPPALVPPAPAPIAILTTGQKAAATRAYNKANGIAPGTKSGTATPATPATPVSDRFPNVILHLVLTIKPDSIAIRFRATRMEDGKPFWSGMASESALGGVSITGTPGEPGDLALYGLDACTLQVGKAPLTSAMLSHYLPMMSTIDGIIQNGRIESEDDSLAFVVSTLASYFKVQAIVVVDEAGNETNHKRGSAYVTAFRIAETFLANHAKSTPAPTV